MNRAPTERRTNMPPFSDHHALMQTPLLPGVSAHVLEGLAKALRGEKLAWPVTNISLKANDFSNIPALLEGLKGLVVQFPKKEERTAVATILSMVAAERASAEEAAKRRVDLVWSGPEGKAQSRDTAIAIGELFARAERKVLMSTYNVGWKKDLFKPLIEKMQRDSQFKLTILVHIDGELTKKYSQLGEEPVAAFRRWFVKTHWTQARLPEVYYDPRGLLEVYVDPLTKEEKFPPKLHAKCIIVDDEVALVTSANFSDAAQNDNIEAGVLVEDAKFARALAQQFEGLVATKKLERVI